MLCPLEFTHSAPPFSQKNVCLHMVKILDALYHFSIAGNIKQTFKDPSQITTQHRKEQHKTSKIPLPKPKFGQKHAPPVAKSVFSFASMRPGSKNGPFSYAAKLIGYRLGKSEI